MACCNNANEAVGGGVGYNGIGKSSVYERKLKCITNSTKSRPATAHSASAVCMLDHLHTTREYNSQNGANNSSLYITCQSVDIQPRFIGFYRALSLSVCVACECMCSANSGIQRARRVDSRAIVREFRSARIECAQMRARARARLLCAIVKRFCRNINRQ